MIIGEYLNENLYTSRQFIIALWVSIIPNKPVDLRQTQFLQILLTLYPGRTSNLSFGCSILLVCVGINGPDKITMRFLNDSFQYLFTFGKNLLRVTVIPQTRDHRGAPH